MDKVRRFLPLIILVGIMILIFSMGWNRYLTLATLRNHGAELRAYAGDHYVLALLSLMAVFTIATASVVPGVFFVTITAGYLFGPWVGGISTAIAATLGALIVYGVARSALGASLRRRAEQNPGLMRSVCEAIDKDTFWYVLASRLAVVVPFHMINLAAGVMAVRLAPYTLATVIGLLPAHIIYCFIGSQLSALLTVNPNPDFAALFASFWAPMTGVFVLAVVLPIVLKTVQARLRRPDALPR